VTELHVCCPKCRRPVVRPGRCACGATSALRQGILDLAPELVVKPGIAMRTMQSRRVAAVYEAVFRPALTRLVTDLSYADEAAFLETWVADGPAVDLACGTGRYTRWLAERLGPDGVLGVDLSWAMLHRASSSLPAVRFVRASALQLPVADGSIGTLTCLGALHLFPDPARCVAEVARVLRPEGRFVCLTAVERARGRRLQRAVGRRIGVSFLEPEALLAWSRGAGLRVCSLERRGAMALLAAERVG
jgi:SAM-dependent methyltransferase